MPKRGSDTDLLGREIVVGDAVVYPPKPDNRQKIEVGRISKFTSKKVEIVHTVDGQETRRQVYARQCVKIPMDDYLMYSLGRS